MTQRSDAQRKAIWANIKGKLSDGTYAKRAALGLGVAAAGGALAYGTRNTALQKKALALAAGGLATAAGYGKQAVDYAHEKEQQAANAAGKARRLAREYLNWSLEQAGNLPVESWTAGAINFPFEIAEGQLAKRFDLHVGNLEKLAASRLGELQAAATEAGVGRVGKAYHHAFPQHLKSTATTGATGTPGSAHAINVKQAYKEHLTKLVEGRKLRRTAEQQKWNKFYTLYFQDMIKTGQQSFIPSKELKEELFQRVGIVPSDTNHRRVNQDLLERSGAMPRY